MSALLYRMPPRSQAAAQQDRIAAERREPAALTSAEISMYRQMLQSLQHLARLAVEIRATEQSHGRTDLTAPMDRTRADLAAAVEAIYRLMASMPEPKLDHVREEQVALLHECAAALGLYAKVA